MVVVTAAAVSAAVACGAAPVALRGDPTTIVRSAADRTMAAGSARVTVGMGVAVGAGMYGTGFADLAGNRADITFVRTGAEARTRDRFEVVVDGAGGYLSGTGPAWLGGPLPALAGAARTRISPLDSLLVRPGAGLAVALLRGAQRVLPYGGEEIEGTNTLRYSFVVDLAQAAALSPPAQRAALDAARRAIGGVLEPADVWLDSAGRVRQLQFATDPLARTTTTRGNFLGITKDGEFLSFIVIDLDRFGTRATIPTIDPAAVEQVAA